MTKKSGFYILKTPVMHCICDRDVLLLALKAEIHANPFFNGARTTRPEKSSIFHGRKLHKRKNGLNGRFKKKRFDS